MAKSITEFLQSVAIVDPKTGLPSDTFLQKINGILRGAASAINGLVFPADDAAVRAGSGVGFIAADALTSAAAPVALTDGSTVAVDWTAGINFTLTMAGNHTIGNPTNGIPGTTRTILVQGDDATDRIITFDTQFLGDVPTITDCDSGRWYKLYLDCIATGHFAVSAKKVKG